jgi:hypothetical protein
MSTALGFRDVDADFRCMEVQVTPDVRIHVEPGEDLYTLRLVGDNSRYEFCAEHELAGTIAILCELDTGDAMTRQRIRVAERRIVSGR